MIKKFGNRFIYAFVTIFGMIKAENRKELFHHDDERKAFAFAQRAKTEFQH